jgi:hypothetical protein
VSNHKTLSFVRYKGTKVVLNLDFKLSDWAFKCLFIKVSGVGDILPLRRHVLWKMVERYLNQLEGHVLANFNIHLLERSHQTKALGFEVESLSVHDCLVDGDLVHEINI